jgi:hypothetical protein
MGRSNDRTLAIQHRKQSNVRKLINYCTFLPIAKEQQLDLESSAAMFHMTVRDLENHQVVASRVF